MKADDPIVQETECLYCLLCMQCVNVCCDGAKQREEVVVVWYEEGWKVGEGSGLLYPTKAADQGGGGKDEAEDESE